MNYYLIHQLTIYSAIKNHQNHSSQTKEPLQSRAHQQIAHTIQQSIPVDFSGHSVHSAFVRFVSRLQTASPPSNQMAEQQICVFTTNFDSSPCYFYPQLHKNITNIGSYENLNANSSHIQTFSTNSTMPVSKSRTKFSQPIKTSRHFPFNYFRKRTTPRLKTVTLVKSKMFALLFGCDQWTKTKSKRAVQMWSKWIS